MSTNALTGRTWKTSYQNVLQMDNSDFDGIKSSVQKVIDGFGNESPLYLGTDKVGINDADKLYFGASNVYLRRLRDGVLKLGADKLVFDGALSANNPFTMVSMVADQVNVIKGVVSNLSAKKGILTTVSAGTVKGTSASITTVNAGVVKGAIDLTGLADKTIKLDGGKLIFSSEVSKGYRNEVEGVSYYFVASGQKVLILKPTSLFPFTNDAMDLGLATKRFKVVNATLFGGETANVSKVYAKNGGYLSNLSRMRAISAYVTRMTAVSHIISPIIYMNSGKDKYIQYDAGTDELRFHDGSVLIDQNGVLRPKTTNNGTVGDPSYIWSKGYFTTLSATTIKGNAVSVAEMNTGDATIAGTKISCASLPSASGDVSTGQLYHDSGTVKIKIG